MAKTAANMKWLVGSKKANAKKPLEKQKFKPLYFIIYKMPKLIGIFYYIMYHKREENAPIKINLFFLDNAIL